MKFKPLLPLKLFKVKLVKKRQCVNNIPVQTTTDRFWRNMKHADRLKSKCEDLASCLKRLLLCPPFYPLSVTFAFEEFHLSPQNSGHSNFYPKNYESEDDIISIANS